MRIAAIVACAQSASLCGLLDAIYSGQCCLDDTGADDASPLGSLRAHAGTYQRHHWVFDWDRVSQWLTTPQMQTGTQVVYAVEPSIDFYGFAVCHEGRMVRQRIGTAREGIVCDVGALLETEYQTITRLMTRAHLDAGLYIWDGDADVAFNTSHCAFGPEIILDLIYQQTGVSLRDKDALGFPAMPPVQTRPHVAQAGASR